MLQPEDVEYLSGRFPGYEVLNESSVICVIIPNFPLPPGFTQTSSNLLLRLSIGYPDIQPDMWWFEPFINRQDGAVINMTQSQERYLNRIWQRWSRHLSPGVWRPGLDSLESYLALVHSELLNAAQLRAA